MENMAIIYKITNTENGWIYIGSTMKSLEERLKAHYRSAKRGIKTNVMYDDMREQEFVGFEIEEIDRCEERHRYIIEEYFTKKAFEKGGYVYNKKLGNTLDRNTVQRIAEARKHLLEDNPDYYQREEFKRASARPGDKNGMYGKKGANAINGRSVYMLDDNDNIVKVFPSVEEAKRFLKTKAHSALCKACREHKKYKGYYLEKRMGQISRRGRK